MPGRQLRPLEGGIEHVAGFHLGGATHGLQVLATRASTTDLFGRTPVAAPFTLFDAQLQYDLQPSLFWQVLTSGGTIAHDANGGSAVLGVTSTAGSRAVHQSRLYCPYEPGMVQKAELTGSLQADAVNLRGRLGYFDDRNGVFLERGPEGEAIVKRSYISGAVVEERVAREDWNMGASVDDLDLTKSQIFAVQLQYLGVGSVEAGFSRAGTYVPVHRFDNDNIRVGAYWTTATLPIRYELENVGGGAGGTMRQVCCSVKSEGGFAPDKGFPFAAMNDAFRPVGTGWAPLLSIRPAAAFKGITNRAGMHPTEFAVTTASNTAVLWEVVFGGTLTGAAWAAADAESAAEYDQTATAITGGVVVARGLAAAGARNVGAVTPASLPNRRWLTNNFEGTAGTALTIRARGISATDAHASVGWLEIR